MECTFAAGVAGFTASCLVSVAQTSDNIKAIVSKYNKSMSVMPKLCLQGKAELRIKRLAAPDRYCALTQGSC